MNRRPRSRGFRRTIQYHTSAQRERKARVPDGRERKIRRRKDTLRFGNRASGNDSVPASSRPLGVTHYACQREGNHAFELVAAGGHERSTERFRLVAIKPPSYA